MKNHASLTGWQKLFFSIIQMLLTLSGRCSRYFCLLGRLLNFWTFRVGAYSRWVLIKFSPFSASVVCLFWNRKIDGNNKTRRCNKARFLSTTLKKTPSSGKSLISLIQFQFQSHCHSSGWAGGGRLSTFSAFKMGAYSRWALIRGWALIRINTVHWHAKKIMRLTFLFCMPYI